MEIFWKRISCICQDVFKIDEGDDFNEILKILSRFKKKSMNKKELVENNQICMKILNKIISF